MRIRGALSGVRGLLRQRIVLRLPPPLRGNYAQGREARRDLTWVRADILVEDTVLLEIKGVAAFIPAHEAQILTYPRMSHVRVGLLLNFHAARLKDGIQRFVA